MIYHFVSKRPPSRGTALLLTIFMMVVLLGFVAFAVDLGYITLARTQLQTAADAAALAAAGSTSQPQEQVIQNAKNFASQNKVGAQNALLNTSDIEFGLWDTTTRTFTPSPGLGNAVRVTAHADTTNQRSVPLFFGRIFNVNAANLQAQAVATTNPRDICFVVDLSGSMNDDTDPNKTSGIDGSYPGVGTQMMQDAYNYFGFGTFPGNSESVGSPLGKSSISGLTSTSSSPLLTTKPQTVTIGGKSYFIPDQYRFTSSTSSSIRTQRAYSWVMDEQMHGMSGSAALPGIMPAAKPRSLVLDASGNLDADQYNYWKAYISSYRSNLGYSSYMHHMMYYGRDTKPSGTNLYTPLSKLSADCPYHTETTDGGVFSFPPREQPTHSSRRAIIAALQIVKDRNQGVSNATQRDQVAIITFDFVAGTTIAHSLNDNYDGAMQDCTTLQATNDTAACTATETGLDAAVSLLNSQGRPTTNKVIVLLTDGVPNLYTTSHYSSIQNYIYNNSSNPSVQACASSYPKAGALWQTSLMQGNNWLVFPVELGLQGDTNFMNCLWSIAQGKTTEILTSPYGTNGDPSNYETELRTIFNKIISSPKLRLVK
jgi:Flp pilus assembly protein TadG